MLIGDKKIGKIRQCLKFEVVSAALCVSRRSLRYKARSNAEFAEDRRETSNQDTTVNQAALTHISGGKYSSPLTFWAVCYPPL
jgi:hypothetical protein